MTSWRSLFLKPVMAVALVAAGLLVAACSDSATSPRATSRVAMQSAARTTVASTTTSYLACPSTQTYRTSRMIGPNGGVLSAGGSGIAIPAGAVPTPTMFTFTVPASDIMQIDVHAENVEHYTFRRPVVISVDYSRCASTADTLPSLSAWYIDPNTRDALAPMGGVDDRLHHRVYFGTDHLSGYAVSERSDTTTTTVTPTY